MMATGIHAMGLMTIAAAIVGDSMSMAARDRPTSRPIGIAVIAARPKPHTTRSTLMVAPLARLVESSAGGSRSGCARTSKTAPMDGTTTLPTDATCQTTRIATGTMAPSSTRTTNRFAFMKP